MSPLIVLALGGSVLKRSTLAEESSKAVQQGLLTQINAELLAPPKMVPSSEKIIVGTSAAFEGASRALGIELYRGSMAYFEHVNQNGGINGKQIFIQAYDDGYNPIPTIQNTIQLAEEDVLLLFNYVGTPTVTRMLPLLNHYRSSNIYLFFPFTGAQPQRQFPYQDRVFNLRASYRQETEGLVDNFIKIGRKRIAILYQIDAYGRSGWDGVKRGLEKYDLDIVEEATYRRGTTYAEDLSQQVAILQSAQPDAIITVGSYAACAAFIRDARDSGLDVPIAVISFVSSENLLTLLTQTGQETGTDYTANLVSSQVVPNYEDVSLPAVREYRQFIEQYDPEIPAEFSSEDYQSPRYGYVSFEGFLNAKLLVEILKRADREDGKYSRQAIAEAAESLDNFDLGIGVPVSFSSDDHQALDQVYYMTVEDGKFVPLEDWQAWAK